jgi:P4 family phage/plasmid primase-like protien
MDKSDVQDMLNFLNAHRMTKNYNENKKVCTHTAYSDPESKIKNPIGKGAFVIDDTTSFELFMEKYKNLVKKIPLHIIERHKIVGPLVIDIDYKLDITVENSDKRHYDNSTFIYLAQKFTTQLKKYFDIDNNLIKSFICEKKSPTKKPKKVNGEYTYFYSDGFHIMYPDIPMNKEKREFIFNKVAEEVKKEDGFKNIKFSNDYDDIFDKSVLFSNGIFLYGSSKPGREPYLLTHVYDCNMNEIDIDENYSDFDELVSCLSLRRYSPEDDIEYKKQYKNIEFVPDNKPTKNKKNMNIYADNEDNNLINDQRNDENDICENDTIKTARILTNMLSPQRANGYTDWIHVCWVLKKISESLFHIFNEFSKKCPSQYDYNACQKAWKTADTTPQVGFTISSLHWWAKQDNPTEYDKFLKEKLSPLIYKAESGTHDDVANIVHLLFSSTYVCVSITKKKWYEFQEHRWVEIDSGFTLRNRIVNEVVNELIDAQTYWVSKIKSSDGLTRDDTMNKIKKIGKVYENLKNEKYSSDIMSACARKFYDDKFMENLDTNRDLLGFDNGVYDLQSGCFRDGNPDDMISMSVRYNYKIFNERDSQIKEIEHFFSMIQIEKDMSNFLKKLIASFIDGHIRDQKFPVFTGSGANGKSTILNLIRQSMGDYYGVLSVTALTQKRAASGNATPEFVTLKGKRLAVMQESEFDESIRVGCMKELTGGDSFPGRALYGDQIMIHPQFKLILVCNKKPKVMADDNGTWRRILVMLFGSEFVQNPTEPNQFKIDRELEVRIKTWSQAFMWLLLNKYYPDYIKNGLIPPTIIENETNEYRQKSDVYLQFVNDNITITNNKKDKIDINALYQFFKFVELK